MLRLAQSLVFGLSLITVVFSRLSTRDAAPPSNVASGTITVGCMEYYTVVSGDGCASIESMFDITFAELISMNPELNSGCTNLLLGEAYCVTLTGTVTAPSNVAPGTLTNGCMEYYTVVPGDQCTSIESDFGITLPDFLAMNPELNSGCTNLVAGDAYCVTSTSTPPPNLAVGTITAGCTTYHSVVSGDECASIESTFGITLAQLIAMNPELNSGCTNLLLGEAYCVASAPVLPPSNLASGTITDGCTQYYTIMPGDGCTSVESAFDLTLTDLRTLNPELNTGCTNLLLGEAYCVQSTTI
ncbi:hypothetical protein B0H11DRAFT_2007939 [Mycena galericulata]|nr:hypothetical protein B0H11DRAFT_2007939 [Mycena galericulata]